MGVLDTHQITPDFASDPPPNFDLQVRQVFGAQGQDVKIIADMGMALWRMITEFREVGITAGALQASPAIPANTLAAIPAGTTCERVKLRPRIYPVADGPNADYRYLRADFDEKRCLVRIRDTDFDPLNPENPCPTLSLWGTELGGAISLNTS